MKLVIVESPAKARTIEKFLGPDYRVEASFGHIRDLPSSAEEIPEESRRKSWAKLGVDTESGFAPLYVVPKDSQKRVNELKKAMKGATEVLLATDEDREGESISWHLLEVLSPKVPVSRITFHEITRPAIQRALETPRQVDEKLVRAQETRRILDRLYGYSLSPVLWKKVRTKLSAGRVQSVALRLVVEREEERQAFKSSEYWDVAARLVAHGQEFPAVLAAVGDQRLATSRDFDATTGALQAKDVVVLGKADAERIAAAVPKVPWRVTAVEKKEMRQKPLPPFTTSTLQQAASSRLHMSPKQTMSVAQRLYEGIELGGGEREGLITYMRTDSQTLSDKALQDAGTLIRQRWGADYHQQRQYKTKSKVAQEAHEAIRPTEMSRTPDSLKSRLKPEELALYRLVWQRTVASQMADAVLDRTSVDLGVTVDGKPHRFRASGSILRFPGYLEVWGGEREDIRLPALAEGDVLAAGSAIDAGTRPAGNVAGATAERHETKPPARYTEASLIKKLEEEGIGRPSTYTPTLSTIQDRGYVVKKGEALVPTYVGMAVTHLLRGHFPQYVDVKFTARMEDDLDSIATGERDWVDFLGRFYWGDEQSQRGDHSHGLVQKIKEELPKIDYPAIPVGTDPETAQPITARIGQSSVYIQRGDGGEGNRVTLPVDLLIDELTPEKVSELFLHRSRGDEPLGVDPQSGQKVYGRVGPYGPYVQLGEGADGEKPKRVSLPRGASLEDLDLGQALKLLSLPRALGVDPESGKPVTAGIGRFGPYVERAGQYQNLRAPDDVLTIDLPTALERLALKASRILKELGPVSEGGAEVKVMAGRFGPYVTDGSLLASLPKGADPEAMTLAEAVSLLAEKGKPRGGGKGRRGAARGKAAAAPAAKKATAKKAAPRAKVGKGGKAAAKKTTRKPAAR
jgi:DNA topoisomerase-1